MWVTVMLLALVVMANPMRTGIAVLLVSRPRPMLNLLAFWLSGIATSSVVGLGVLFVLSDSALTVVQHLESTAASATAGRMRLALGGLALLAAAGLSVRHRVPAPIPGGDGSVRVAEPRTPTAFSRLATRARDVLDGDSLSVAVIAGFGAGIPAEYLAALLAILASGAGPGTQISAVVAFILVAFAVVEIPLVGYRATPAKTEAVMLEFHRAVRARRRQVLAVMAGVLGVFLLTSGMGIV